MLKYSKDLHAVCILKAYVGQGLTRAQNLLEDLPYCLLTVL